MTTLHVEWEKSALALETAPPVLGGATRTTLSEAMKPLAYRSWLTSAKTARRLTVSSLTRRFERSRGSISYLFLSAFT